MSRPNHKDSGLMLALAKAGSATAIARACGITPEAVMQWGRIPISPKNRVLQIEAAFDIPRELLRPDVYGAPRARPRMQSEAVA